MTPGRPLLGTRSAIVAVLAVLVAVNLTRSTVVPGEVHLWFNLANGAIVLLIGLLAGLRHDEFGTRRDRLRSGVRWGLGAAGVVTAAVVVGAVLTAVVPAAPDAFDDERAAVGFAEMALRAFVIIPIGTVLVEEIVFRGVLHGLLRRLLAPWPALLVGSVVFAAWHLFPAARGSDENAVTGSVGLFGILGGTFAATFLAGLVFGWLRDRSGSLAAPGVAHIGTNSVPLVVAWIVGRITP